MKDAPASLSNLHDLVPPEPIGWWPLAPGWYVVGILLLLTAGWLGLRAWKQWQANAYRRAALRELDRAEGAVEVAAILRRTALAGVPRGEVASKSGGEWAEWLTSFLSDPMPEDVRRQLGSGLYDPQADSDSISLRKYADRWIRYHSFDPDKIT